MQLIDWAIGPVWEANHVWLIFVLVVLWTGFPTVFEAIFSTLFVPLSLAALGIVLRGSAFAFQHTARRERGRALATTVFGASSVLTPFFLGTVVGAVAGGRVPVGNAAGDIWTSWANPLSVVTGVLFVATGAYLASVFLVDDARRAGTPDLERYFSDRALVAAIVTGALAAAGLVMLHRDARDVFDGLTSDGLPLVLLSLASRPRGTRPLAARRPARRARARGRRRRVRDLGLGGRAAPGPAAAEPDRRRCGRPERDVEGAADRLRDRRGGRPTVARPALHAGAAEPRGGDVAAGERPLSEASAQARKQAAPSEVFQFAAAWSIIEPVAGTT